MSTDEEEEGVPPSSDHMHTGMSHSLGCGLNGVYILPDWSEKG